MPTESTNNVYLRLVQHVDIKTLISLLDIRNEEGVRKWMYSDHVIEINEHLQWLNALKDSNDTLAFVILDESGAVLGMIKLSSINWLHKTSDWAFYLSEEARGGLGAVLEYSFIDFVFEKLEFEKLNCEVIEGNDKVVKLHRKFLFKEEGFRESNIIKSGVRKGVHFLGLTRESWQAGKNEIYEKYRKTFDKVRIVLDWNEGELLNAREKGPIDKIESARARNNLNWMNILRLALEESPKEGRRLVEDIRNIDKEISVLTDELLGSGTFAEKLKVSGEKL